MYGLLRERIGDSRDMLDDLAFADTFAPYVLATGALDPGRDAGLLSVGYMIARERCDLDAAMAMIWVFPLLCAAYGIAKMVLARRYL